MEENIELEDINIGEYLPKQRNELLTAEKLAEKVTAKIKALKQVDTRFGKKLVADIELSDGQHYTVFINKLSVQELYKAEPDVKKWLDKQVAIDKVQVVVRGSLRNTLLVKFA